MTNENYHKCRSCKYCKHEGDQWTCLLDRVSTTDDTSCDRYRPGSCECCGFYDHGVCSRTGEDVLEFEVCPDFDPHGLI